MKNRRIVVVAFLLVAALTLGIGYAALTDHLNIIGNAVIDMAGAESTFDSKVYFSAAAVTDGDDTKDVASYTADEATFTANSLAVLGDSATFTFTIKSESNVDVEISVAPTKLSGTANPSSSNEEYFKVTYAYPQGTTIAAGGGTITVEVTVEVIKPVTSPTGGTFGIELTATTVEATNP